MKIEKIFLFLATLFIALFMFLVPVTQVPDETTHAIIAWDITHDAAKEDSLQWLAKHQMEVISNKSSVAPAVISNKKLNRFFTEKKRFFKRTYKIKSFIEKFSTFATVNWNVSRSYDLFIIWNYFLNGTIG
ncbi:hypothetical protein MX009_01710 [Streptococcus uberis]|uniref:hypothetical protein n=1 Tax=Streptococcus uberis TaxID=1349 RepID=UPI001FF5676A|nr:hypothetical protein [Streptococcus uberis]MCK1192349.1 hypothetical protein [Streptococcus uberis]MCK1229137.1 hypothetical protein [Streptococcus uberis]MCK1240272.1 hypothetical protein [Streptococcus uberis]MCK1241998.1 hypothetical protein [Streptococcus uberis]MCK1243949.1 hypothetical protein [Streptococcus uberis]